VNFLSESEVLLLHGRIIDATGGSRGLRDRGALQASVAQPLQTFADRELYSSIEEKAAALGFFLVANHPFVDGNKRIGHAAMEVVLVLNGRELSASIEEQEAMILGVASGRIRREEFTAWVQQHVVPRA
jgi:death on curing protein